MTTYYFYTDQPLDLQTVTVEKISDIVLYPSTELLERAIKQQTTGNEIYSYSIEIPASSVQELASNDSNEANYSIKADQFMGAELLPVHLLGLANVVRDDVTVFHLSEKNERNIRVELSNISLLLVFRNQEDAQRHAITNQLAKNIYKFGLSNQCLVISPTVSGSFKINPEQFRQIYGDDTHTLTAERVYVSPSQFENTAETGEGFVFGNDDDAANNIDHYDESLVISTPLRETDFNSSIRLLDQLVKATQDYLKDNKNIYAVYLEETREHPKTWGFFLQENTLLMEENKINIADQDAGVRRAANLILWLTDIEKTIQAAAGEHRHKVSSQANTLTTFILYSFLTYKYNWTNQGGLRTTILQNIFGENSFELNKEAAFEKIYLAPKENDIEAQYLNKALGGQFLATQIPGEELSYPRKSLRVDPYEQITKNPYLVSMFRAQAELKDQAQTNFHALATLLHEELTKKDFIPLTVRDRLVKQILITVAQVRDAKNHFNSPENAATVATSSAPAPAL